MQEKRYKVKSSHGLAANLQKHSNMNLPYWKLSAANCFGIVIKVYASLVSAFPRDRINKSSVNLRIAVSDNAANHKQTMKHFKLAYFWKASFKLIDMKC